jgi:hypothetical protein
MKKFITPKNYPHDKCVNVNFAFRKKEITGIMAPNSTVLESGDTYGIIIKQCVVSHVIEYSDKMQRDQVFDLMLKDLN